MKFPFLGILGLQSKTIPIQVKEQFFRNFPNAINIDWETKGKSYEAVFYQDEKEYIARFSHHGDLIEYKKNLWPEELSDPIAEQCRLQGEIMNVIAIYRENKTFFEVIIRNNQLKRTLFIFNQDAKLIENRKL